MTKKSHRADILILDNRGLIFADFIFALVLAASASIILFAMTFTFSMVEVAQYVVFSSARAYIAGGVDNDQQTLLGKDKFKELLKNQDLAPLLGNPSGHWFILGGNSQTLELKGGEDAGGTFDDYAGYKDDSGYGRIPFVGARADFEAKLLDLNIPLLGKTNDGNGFTAKLTAFLIREPTQKECWEKQIKVRYTNILNLDSRYQGSGTTNASSYVSKYVPMEDNGC
jgi:hypothetical protein